MKNPLIIFGSSRSKGDTFDAIQMVLNGRDIPIVNLNDLDISQFDYDYQNESDDFLPLAHKMLDADSIIIASPIYWYSMSAIMKVFVDRISDLTIHRKELGRKLKGKDVYLVTASANRNGEEEFEIVFAKTFDYLDMNYKGCFFYYSGGDEKEKAKNAEGAKKIEDKIFKGYKDGNT